MANARNTRSIINFPLAMINEKWKIDKPSTPGDGQIKNWTNREGAQERGEQRQNYPWRGGVRSC